MSYGGHIELNYHLELDKESDMSEIRRGRHFGMGQSQSITMWLEDSSGDSSSREPHVQVTISDSDSVFTGTLYLQKRRNWIEGSVTPIVATSEPSGFFKIYPGCRPVHSEIPPTQAPTGGFSPPCPPSVFH